MPKKKANNTLGRTLNATSGKSTYDKQVKKLLADKQVLARIIKSCTNEFRNNTIGEIIACIDTVDIGCEIVNPDGSVTTLNLEDYEEGSGNVYYDIFLHITTKGEHPIRIYLDIEAQNAYNNKYTIPERGIYYCSRMISRQGREELDIAQHEYNKIKKVYSIWICPKVPKYVANTITVYKMTQQMICGTVTKRYENRWKSNRYDLLEVVVICTDENEQTDDKLIGMLNILLSNRLSAEEKKKKLHEEYEIETSSELGKEIDEMTNLSIGFEKEITKRVREEERKKAKSKEKDNIKNTYDLIKEANENLADEAIVKRIADKFKMSVRYVNSILF